VEYSTIHWGKDTVFKKKNVCQDCVQFVSVFTVEVTGLFDYWMSSVMMWIEVPANIHTYNSHILKEHIKIIKLCYNFNHDNR
jgi:hypothetical protein